MVSVPGGLFRMRIYRGILSCVIFCVILGIRVLEFMHFCVILVIRVIECKHFMRDSGASVL